MNLYEFLNLLSEEPVFHDRFLVELCDIARGMSGDNSTLTTETMLESINMVKKCNFNHSELKLSIDDKNLLEYIEEIYLENGDILQYGITIVNDEGGGAYYFYSDNEKLLSKLLV